MEDTNRCIQAGNLSGGKWDKMHEISRRYYSTGGVSPTLHTCPGGNTEIKIIEDFYKCREPREYEEYAPTLRSERIGLKVDDNYRIRKVTPVEQFRLMGMTTEDAEKARNIGMSDCSMYKQTGNGLVCQCVQLIFEHLYKAQYDENYICTDESI